MSSKCPFCKRAKCVWVDIKDPKKATTERLEELISHNISYINMVFAGNQGSSGSEERMYDNLDPYQQELDRRGVGRGKN
jgi:hypothetical protein